MRAKEFLNWIRTGTGRLRRMQEQRRMLMSSQYPGAMRLKVVQVQESAPGDKIARVQGDLDVLTARIDAQLEELKLARAYAEEIIDDIEDRHQRQVLTLYYLTTYTAREEIGKTHLMMQQQINLTWWDVSREIRLPLRKVHAIHAAAVRAFGELAELPDSLPC